MPLTLQFHYDAGHGWVRVPKYLLKQVPEAASKITRFSYQDDTFFYLEEDVDGPSILGALEEKGIEVTLVHVNDGDDSPIRNMRRVRFDATQGRVWQ